MQINEQNNSKSKSNKYFLIALEGLDCSGKSTLSNLLLERLKPSILIGFPDRNTPTGNLINKFLKKEANICAEELHLLFSANRYEKMQFIKDNLKNSNIICDRYSLSGIIYSMAKGLNYDWCKIVESLLPKPDFTFFLDINAENTSKRRNFGSEAHDKIEFQNKIYDLYIDKSEIEKLIFVDGSLKPEEMADFIIKYIKNKDN